MATTPSTPEPANIKARLKEAYDAIAPTYNAWTAEHSPKRLEYLEQVIALLREQQPKKASSSQTVRVLELGCGAGKPVTERLLQAFSSPVQVTANDLSATQIQLGKEALGEHGEKVAGANGTVEWVEGDMMALEFPQGTGSADAPAGLDAVAAFFSIIHLPLHEQTELLGRIARWLKPGGYFVANFSENAHPGIVMKNWLKQEKGWMFWSGHGVDETVKQIKDAGLNVLVNKVELDDVDANFLWIIAQKPEL